MQTGPIMTAAAGFVLAAGCTTRVKRPLAARQ
jgi:hypothetical protein